MPPAALLLERSERRSVLLARRHACPASPGGKEVRQPGGKVRIRVGRMEALARGQLEDSSLAPSLQSLECLDP
jgi:hypothetical protein